jgi:hypothetical protein
MSMIFYEFTQIGEFHDNHNEDYCIIEDAGKNYKLIAVMDGCSSGSDSYFASTLIGKILRKLAKHEAYREYAEDKELDTVKLMETISLNLFDNLNHIYNFLDLKSNEILSTLILGIVNTKNQSAEIRVVGDGLIFVDGQKIEFDNNNRPDYLGYHLTMDKQIWFQTRTKKISIRKFNDLSISTDGIFTFKNHDGKIYPKITDDDILHEFYLDMANLETPNKLKKSFLKIKDEFGQKPNDDLSIVRVICI